MRLKNKCINANVILACAATGRQKGTLLPITHRRQYLVGNIVFGSLDNKALAIGGDSVTRNEDTAEKRGTQKRRSRIGYVWLSGNQHMDACSQIAGAGKCGRAQAQQARD